MGWQSDKEKTKDTYRGGGDGIPSFDGHSKGGRGGLKSAIMVRVCYREDALELKSTECIDDSRVLVDQNVVLTAGFILEKKISFVLEHRLFGSWMETTDLSANQVVCGSGNAFWTVDMSMHHDGRFIRDPILNMKVVF
ncbi:hypothetical protein CRG98_035102 [Punica granatum]|uniref:Uncharacterized protein n=1 Tax=Punica granatum TaxID=22663 RepID=A0A2I0IKI1_PUNGR|nr:hypothetical protein CRG98_035102 [Punica granatum]